MLSDSDSDSDSVTTPAVDHLNLSSLSDSELSDLQIEAREAYYNASVSQAAARAAAQEQILKAQAALAALDAAIDPLVNKVAVIWKESMLRRAG